MICRNIRVWTNHTQQFLLSGSSGFELGVKPGFKHQDTFFPCYHFRDRTRTSVNNTRGKIGCQKTVFFTILSVENSEVLTKITLKSWNVGNGRMDDEKVKGKLYFEKKYEIGQILGEKR